MSLPHQNLPAPDGRDAYGPAAWWRLSSGCTLFATPGQVHLGAVMDPDSAEQDAFAVLAAAAWARGEGS